MGFIVSVLRIMTAIVFPLAAIVFCVLTLIVSRKTSGFEPEQGQLCVRCGQHQDGMMAHFHYAESVGNARERAAKKQLLPSDTPMLGAEEHFVCDQCANRYILLEVIQVLLMILLYPLYLYVIPPIFVENGILNNFLIETLLIVLAVVGTISAYDMFRATRAGERALDEARDRVAINTRKRKLGKKFSYYTRIGYNHLQR
jgi:hypothetical protein